MSVQKLEDNSEYSFMEYIGDENVKVSRIKLAKIMMLCMVLMALSFLLIEHSISAKAKPTKGVDTNGNTWTYDKKTKTLTFKGTKDLEENLMDGHSSEPEWFCWDEEVEHLVIKEGISGLPGGEFSLFTKLKTVELPDSVTYIGDCVFDSCMNLEQIQMSKNITKIGDFAFDGCRN
ncbi:leucine-rich repeat domain-containing protein, partial [Anaerosporobacter sp.]|uniref:leucine-rich repeat domain-containing protein n=1 Tax=Anaerosporobacter sp. TaxID=1872529 RepID=UPI00286F3B37